VGGDSAHGSTGPPRFSDRPGAASLGGGAGGAGSLPPPIPPCPATRRHRHTRPAERDAWPAAPTSPPAQAEGLNRGPPATHAHHPPTHRRRRHRPGHSGAGGRRRGVRAPPRRPGAGDRGHDGDGPRLRADDPAARGDEGCGAEPPRVAGDDRPGLVRRGAPPEHACVTGPALGRDRAPRGCGTAAPPGPDRGEHRAGELLVQPVSGCCQGPGAGDYQRPAGAPPL
jgi:hypothetical protein